MPSALATLTSLLFLEQSEAQTPCPQLRDFSWHSLNPQDSLLMFSWFASLLFSYLNSNAGISLRFSPATIFQITKMKTNSWRGLLIPFTLFNIFFFSAFTPTLSLIFIEDLSISVHHSSPLGQKLSLWHKHRMHIEITALCLAINGHSKMFV